MKELSELPKVVIGVPGTWNGHSDIVASIAKNSGGYFFAGMFMMHIDTKWLCNLEIYDRDPEMRRAFELASGGNLPDAELSLIDQHTHTVYLSADGGSIENARNLMRAAGSLLHCGGIAVKIESTGLAHSKTRWLELTNDELPTAVMTAFVTYVGNDSEYYSCGMHNLGLRDAVITADISPSDAANLLLVFLRFITIEEPMIHDGETFSVDENAPKYRLTRTACTMFKPGDLFHNPFGVWRLVPA